MPAFNMNADDVGAHAVYDAEYGVSRSMPHGDDILFSRLSPVTSSVDTLRLAYTSLFSLISRHAGVPHYLIPRFHYTPPLIGSEARVPLPRPSPRHRRQYHARHI